MSILKLARSSGNTTPSPDGFVWNIRISERVLVAFFVVSGSFVSGMAYGQSQAASKVQERPPLPTQITPCPAITKPTVGLRSGG